MTDTPDDPSPFRGFTPSVDGYRWNRVAFKPYKEDERAQFKDISRQTLFSRPDLAGELRYFEVAAGGFSTLERHRHVHAVLILRGSGQALVGDRIHMLAQNDLVTVAPMTWHQFRASRNEPLGFLCMVDATRDKPQLPTQTELSMLMGTPAIARFIGGN
jgi:mannose-6-phosphate isomerase-like protein (cupin superfamily)